MKYKKILLIVPPLATVTPFILHGSIQAKADTTIKLVAINEDGTPSSQTYLNGKIVNSTTTSVSSPDVLNSAPETGISASQPTEIATNSTVSGYVPVNIINENSSKLDEQKKAKEAYQKLVEKRQAEALAKQKAEEQARALAEQKAQQEKELAEQQAQKEAQQLSQQQAQNTSVNQSSQQNTGSQTTTTSNSTPNYSGGLNMNQTSGLVDINALANYMASTVGGSVDKWAYTIEHESGGDLTNWYNKAGGNPYTQGYTAYGVFQLLGHGEYYGMTLGEQISIAQKVYLSSGFGAWVASYSY
jgi:outer membrane biosynthesis protein TonB